MPKTPHSILVVEDSPEDFEATCRAFDRAGVAARIERCRDGDELLSYVRSADGRGDRPSLILLDLNLPGTDGRDALATLKQDSRTREIPVIVLTTSSDDRDVDWCYRLGANSYIQKPVDLEDYMDLIRLIAEYWLHTVALPRGDGAG
jgi:two-component system response regulator